MVWKRIDFPLFHENVFCDLVSCRCLSGLCPNDIFAPSRPAGEPTDVQCWTIGAQLSEKGIEDGYKSLSWKFEVNWTRNRYFKIKQSLEKITECTDRAWVRGYAPDDALDSVVAMLWTQTDLDFAECGVVKPFYHPSPITTTLFRMAL